MWRTAQVDPRDFNPTHGTLSGSASINSLVELYIPTQRVDAGQDRRLATRSYGHQGLGAPEVAVTDGPGHPLDCRVCEKCLEWQPHTKLTLKSIADADRRQRGRTNVEERFING